MAIIEQRLTSPEQEGILPANSHQTSAATWALLRFLGCWSTLQILDRYLHKHVGCFLRINLSLSLFLLCIYIYTSILVVGMGTCPKLPIISIVRENKWVLVAKAERTLRNNVDLWYPNSFFPNQIWHSIPLYWNGVKEPTYFNCLILLPSPLPKVLLEAQLLNLNLPTHCLQTGLMCMCPRNTLSHVPSFIFTVVLLKSAPTLL